MKYFTQVREQKDGSFQIVGGENPDAMKEVGCEATYKKAQQYRAWWLQSMGVAANQVNHGLVSLNPIQGHVPGH